MWNAVDASFLGDFQPLDTYLYYDGPRTFSVKHGGKLYFAHQCDEEVEYMSFFVREVTPEQLDEVEGNKIPLRDFLVNARPFYLVRVYNHTGRLEAFQVEPSDFAPDHFPKEGVFLTAG